ncbi:Vi polysaccharide biosynthesis UDP-N-acetylglucosamine C-6 dehydrogenase TviB [Cycloclasticus pugetii]|jgi:UDP-N-acetyl-D-galactosamine dehydrogenase|uniref:Vi polysaccharide biosynthesis UDP-N-acetylglucosamine C-6 dehydrogenase TviB n=1 Tax=Cycloclasticus pugetii TaxID=34068 RepID=UPI000915C220|nr:Vi polysaccharide biosynthesis UDP-N-acetylglucosamine C-6 dehydrogenase TviB [Cycloclasticus pugetii]SHJ63472.1 UDP-N-acetyl-D-galactosamine dehydrogenase [Cycloclasticus pugetii]
MEFKIAVIGLGYVGLPLAVEFGKQFPTVGYDINETRIAELNAGVDSTLETTSDELASASQLTCTASASSLADCNIYIVTVPTPINTSKTPDLTPIISATKLLAEYLKKGDVVIYESTVYPGATEEVCVPILEQLSGLRFNVDFYCGYSPERINPGDKTRRLTNILKVTSGSTPAIATMVDELYQSIITAGTHKASSIKVAEAAKVIENTQRDINIALVNELALIFNRVGIDTEEVLEAAGTKWNFLPFRPGLVGGHCIGVDPYYLVHKAETLGYHPQLVSAGRRINDNMGHFVVSEVVKLMASKKLNIVDAKILMLGLTFKENCPDLRNTRVVEMIEELTNTYNAKVDVFDPWVDKQEAQAVYNLNLIDQPAAGQYDAMIVAVSHEQFKKLGIEGVKALGKDNHVVYDIKYLFPSDSVDGRL